MSNQTNEIIPIQAGDSNGENGRDEADYLSFRPGQRLRKARELRGMTIEQVARELNLTPRYVQAMETDSYKELPEPAFVRGYMRRYAHLVKLSPDDIAAKFDQCYAEDKETPALEVRPRNPVQVLGIIARRPRLKPRRLLSWGALLFILILVAGFLWNGLSSRGTLPVMEEPAFSPQPPAAVTPVVPAPAPAVPATEPPQAAVPATPAVPTPTPTPAAPAPATGMSVLPTPTGPAVLPTPGGAAPAPAAPAAPVTR